MCLVFTYLNSKWCSSEKRNNGDFLGLLLLQAQVPVPPEVWIYLRANSSVRMSWIFMNMGIFWMNIIAIFVSHWSVNWMLARAEQQLKHKSVCFNCCSAVKTICSQTVHVEVNCESKKVEKQENKNSPFNDKQFFFHTGNQTNFCLCWVSGANAVNAGRENSLLSECWIGKFTNTFT